MQHFTILQYKLHSFKLLKTIEARLGSQNHIYGQPVLTFAVRAVASVWTNINSIKLQRNKKFIMFIFYSMVLSMCNL